MYACVQILWVFFFNYLMIDISENKACSFPIRIIIIIVSDSEASRVDYSIKKYLGNPGGRDEERNYFIKMGRESGSDFFFFLF